MHDSVEGLPLPYKSKFTLWGSEGKTYCRHDLVPSVGLSTTYSVRIVSNPVDVPVRYVLVEENRIVTVSASEPLDGHNIFDVDGKYLGQGGEKDDASSMPEPLPNPEGEPVVGLPHTFFLRPECLLRFDLPIDLTRAEVARIQKWLETLVFE
jgi:hypothetical protein